MPSAEFALPLSDQAPALARHQLVDLLGDWGRSETRETAALLVSELVTNAVRHSRSAPRMTVVMHDGYLRCSVYDADPTHPQQREPSLEGDGGRGLLLVSALASAWGVQDKLAGKAVWFELRVAT